jgi:hypothetical protein
MRPVNGGILFWLGVAVVILAGFAEAAWAAVAGDGLGESLAIRRARR